MTSRSPLNRLALTALAAAVVLAGCASSGRAPSSPELNLPANFKEATPAAGWVAAQPADSAPRGPWWQRFGDAELDALVAQVTVSNQNVAAAVARYAAAQALVAGERARLLPGLQLSGGASRSGGGGDTPSRNSFQLGLGASWEPDLWGRLRGAVTQAEANAQASAADLAGATLSAQALLATDYFLLREADAELALLRSSVAGFERSAQIAQNRYAAGQVARTDVLQAETQLANARADLAALDAQRRQFEHAIAVLVGRAPADFTLAPAPWVMQVPAVPPALPSELLQRRPDIASAERAVAAANARIGIARAAYFPSLSLNASGGSSAARLADLFSASHLMWSLGLSIAQTLFDGGALNAALRNAEASREVTVATYRQTVLSAFQSVEDLLANRRALHEQLALRQQASAAADLSEQQVLNRYRAGQISYTEVVAAQATALTARRGLVQLQASLQTNAVALIQAMGGDWDAAQLGRVASSG
ncbi:efflux transporter outer membrane subunit [Aquincola sp. S2]|uniref:Efflux transporter outer membrane subunit n=1 Tax=Pseudaquabacterium terrae TaxID=2732868 RepID=A0ABX2EN42_9BURK|nr:efflux transporter outer membrane subunit [Aquabacterium terrae]NRF70038.1 efflux transporter outer membrane subunit [Aquabacterium terrae]